MNQQRRNRGRFGKRRFVMFPVFALIAALILGAVIQWLWNAIFPHALNANPISYWQAVGLFVLSKILFGGFRGPMSGPGRWGNWRKFDENATGPGARFGAWRSKWKSMSDEERTKFKQEMRRRCGRPPENH
ncbi:poly-gamma-glutamate biosynthesis protein PgsC/CapC [Dyadobacter sp. CY323]|uniref:poly-gamma-glutamate biosynthesis protein PgsC/CapC n=1 Tax=Dyadobacter sp. CY323 TaxID=2907302 RepID=UPI001F1FF5F7|nr:poly-gamma-glutamate biosynthesis protein PgsC/CapC [Dyadobacter sp. CY323]MCE6992332.1 poly-gamma-glutamate biosynthesis protein PgsC/CapC [Dyadobacter sp. CY323]